MFCSIPTWVTELLALVSAVSLAVPAWRIDKRLRAIFDAKQAAASYPDRKINRLSRAWAKAARSTLDEWNVVHSRWFRVGVAMAVIAGSLSLVGALAAERCAPTQRATAVQAVDPAVSSLAV